MKKTVILILFAIWLAVAFFNVSLGAKWTVALLWPFNRLKGASSKTLS